MTLACFRDNMLQCVILSLIMKTNKVLYGNQYEFALSIIMKRVTAVC